MRRIILLALTCGLVPLEGCLSARRDERVAAQQQIEAQRRLEARIEALVVETARLRAALDTVSAQNDSLLKSTARLEADVREREEQMRAIRLELQRLKEIDLKPRPRPN